MEQPTATKVRVLKTAAGPLAQVVVDSKVRSADLGGLIQKVVTDEKILKAAGLKVCPGCKSGLDIHILDKLPQIIDVAH
jgi:hypothetical protein